MPTPGQIHRRIRRLERSLRIVGDGLPACAECNSGGYLGPSVRIKENEPVPECRCTACGRTLVPGVIEREFIDPKTGLEMMELILGTPPRTRKTPRRPGSW